MEDRRKDDGRIMVMEVEIRNIMKLLEEVRDELKSQRELHARQADVVILEERVAKLEEFRWYLVGGMAVGVPVVSYIVNKIFK
jgi:polyhydroxyalkanoate synthesis regulator phasin